MDQNHTIRKHLGTADVVRDDNGRHLALLLQLENQLTNFRRGDRIKTSRRLIEKQDVWIQGKSASQTHSLLHATGELRRHLLEVLIHSDTSEEFPHPLVSVGVRHCGVPAQRKRYVFLDR